MAALLERYKCPTPFHAVRTRFMGSIASPAETISPIETLKQLWHGELPAFESMEDLNYLLNVLINELWNQLTKHQAPATPFRLTRIEVSPTREDLRNFARVRQQEIEGFIEGVFGSNEALDLPETAHKAVDVLGEVRAMLAGAGNLLEDDSKSSELSELKALIYNLQEIGEIAEKEMNAAIQSCRRARDQGGPYEPANNPTIH
jgi:hypothetical protein